MPPFVHHQGVGFQPWRSGKGNEFKVLGNKDEQWLPSRRTHSGDLSVNRRIQCDVQGAETQTVLSPLALLCILPLRGKEDKPLTDFSWKDLSLIQRNFLMGWLRAGS